jgi:anhydro-N-acetylmuramic acid kinase
MRAVAELAARDPKRVVGLISGTSGDGIDAALVEVRGRGLAARVRLEAGLTLPFPPADRDELFRMFDPAGSGVDRICRFNFRLGELFAEAALAVVRKAGLSPREVDLIGSAGQTIWHIPAPDGATFQIGESAVIAERTGLPVIGDVRVADMAAGGHGAPLVSYFDLVVLRDAHRSRAVQNIGGIGNVTHLPAACGPEDVRAFDTGPGNMVIDAVVQALTDGREAFDRDGMMATRGRVDDTFLAELLADDYLRMAPPKTTGRELYGRQYADRVLAEAQRRGLAAEDIVATVSALTADSIVNAYRDFILPRGTIDEVILGGGGAYNEFLRRRIAAGLGVRVGTVDDYGVDGKLKEAMAFALMAADAVWGLPTNVPAVTAAAGPRVLGKLVAAPSWGTSA